MVKRNILFLALALLSVMGTASAGTLGQVKKRGTLICGSSSGLAGFGLENEKGSWTGFDIDFCRALAAAIFDDVSKVQFMPVSAKDRFAALQSGQIDVLARNVVWALSRDAGQGIIFTGVNYFDGQALMAHENKQIKSVRDLSGASICVQQGTTSELSMADFFGANNIPFTPLDFATLDEAITAYDGGRCAAVSARASSLYAERMKLSHPGENIILPEIISKEPLSPAVRQGDDEWFDIVKWVNFAMIDAEEAGITSKNVDEMAKSDAPVVRRLLGLDGNFGEALGLTPDWAYRIIKRVGNYGEVFDRNLGGGSDLHIKRGLNALWTSGGLQYAPPIR